jgi:hypothetical protein
MNAVDAAEQLMAVGRRLQALERQLQRPVVPLASGGVWGELAADPVARLSDLLASCANQTPASLPPVPSRASPPYRWEARPAASRDASPSTTVPPEEVVGIAPPERFPFADETPRGMTRRFPGDAPTISDLAHAAEPSQPDGVRLTRAPSSLLSILQSNLRPTDQANATPPSSGSGTESPRLGAQAEPGELRPVGGNTAISGNRPADRAAQQSSGDPARAQALFWARNDSRAGGQAEPLESPVHLGEDVFPASEGFVESGEGWPSRGDMHPAPLRPPSPVYAEARFDPLHRSATASVDSGSVLRWPAFPPPIDDGAIWWEPASTANHPSGDGAIWREPTSATNHPSDDGAIWQEPASTTSHLSDEQIDQILDALDDRLELMLLRMYGTSTL